MRATHANWWARVLSRGQQQQRLYARHRASQCTLTGGMLALDTVSSGLFAKPASDVDDLECESTAINCFTAMRKQTVQGFLTMGIR